MPKQNLQSEKKKINNITWFKGSEHGIWYDLQYPLTFQNDRTIRRLRYRYAKSKSISYDEEQTRLSKMIHDPHLVNSYKTMRKIMKNKKQLESSINFSTNRGKIFNEYKNVVLGSVRIVSAKQFKSNFEACVSSAKAQIGSEPYGLLLGQVPPLSLTKKDTIRKIDRPLIKSSVFLAHVIEKVMGRPAHGYVTLDFSESEMQYVSKKHNINTWVWFDDGVYSGTQMRKSFDLYRKLPGKFIIIAPYATKKVFDIPKEIKSRVIYTCVKVLMDSANTILRRSGFPENKIRELEIGKIGRSMFILPHKIPNEFSFELFENIYPKTKNDLIYSTVYKRGSVFKI